MGKYTSMGWNNPDHLTGYSYFVTYENDKFVLKKNMSQPYIKNNMLHFVNDNIANNIHSLALFILTRCK